MKIIYTVGFLYVIFQSFYNLNFVIESLAEIGSNVYYIGSKLGFYHYRYVEFGKNTTYNFIRGEIPISELELKRMYGTFIDFFSFILLKAFVHLLNSQENLRNYINNESSEKLSLDKNINSN